jgi:hypothetical protein
MTAQIPKPEDYYNVADKGPWQIDVWPPRSEEGLDRLVLQSDDFNHDVAMEITGDFWDNEQKMLYACALRDQLNSSIKKE